MTCTSLDHCYPQNAPNGKTAPGTPCYCRRRRWGASGSTKATASPLRMRRFKVGDAVLVLGTTEPRTVTKREREDGVDIYILDAPVGGRKYYERTELAEVA